MIGGIAVCAAVVVAAIALANAVVITSTKDDIVDPEEAVAFNADAIVVLGASVYIDGTPSAVLQDRLDDAIALYFAGVAPKIIMSGDGSTESYNEPAAMKEYAISQGVPSEDIFCDAYGFSTYDTMYRAKHVFGVNRAVVTTQTWHLYRALYIAQTLGMDAVGVASDYRQYRDEAWYNVREIPIRAKDAAQALLQLPSRVVGGAVSLDQSGDATQSSASQK